MIGWFKCSYAMLAAIQAALINSKSHKRPGDCHYYCVNYLSKVSSVAKEFAIAFVQVRQKWTAFTFAQWPFPGVCVVTVQLSVLCYRWWGMVRGLMAYLGKICPMAALTSASLWWAKRFGFSAYFLTYSILASHYHCCMFLYLLHIHGIGTVAHNGFPFFYLCHGRG